MRSGISLKNNGMLTLLVAIFSFSGVRTQTILSPGRGVCGLSLSLSLFLISYNAIYRTKCLVLVQQRPSG